MASAAARKKGGCVRQENACLITDERFHSNLDALQFEPEASDLQVHHSLSRVMVSSSMAAMSEHIHQLEAELEAQTEELKAAELRAESCQEAAAHSEAVVATVTEELRMLREELESRTVTGKRAEQQRNQALQNAEKLKEAFDDYKDTFSLKLQKVVESETTLKESLMESNREKQELEVKFSVLERERAEQSQTVSQLQEELRQGGAAAALLQAQLEQAARRASQLEQQLSERGAECKEAASLRREVEELRTLTRDQEQKATQTQAELSALEAVLALLHLQEAPAGPTCSSPCVLPPVDYSGAAHLLNLKPGEGYQQLLRVLQVKEAERLKQQSQKERLQERLSRAQEEISSLQSSMAQRASHYQNLHTELLERGSQATDAQKELKRKSARVAALEKQLQEKSSAYSLAALKNTELENELKEKSSSVQHYQGLMSRKQKEHQKALDQCKQTHSKHLAEQQHRIEMLQLSVEESLAQMLELEQQLGSVQTERDKAQKAALLLQTSVDRLTQEKQVEVRRNQEMLQSFKDQASHSATMISELQSCLSACKEELNSYLQQMEELKRKHETELQRKNEKMSCLQEKLHSTSLVCQSSSEQNLQLQESLQQQQTMLTESTARVSELEESQSHLQRQVSGLEQQLERTWASLQDEVRSRGLEAQAAERNLQETTEQNTQLSKSISHLRLKMEKLEVELEHLRSQVAAKAEQIIGLEENLQRTQSQVISKTSTVEELEEKLHRCEEERLCSMQRVKVLEGELRSVQAELDDTVERVQELHDVLQRTQTVSDQRQAQVDKLGMRLSETQRDLEERTHEVLDMDNALKERQEELQQRAKLLNQLDEAIKEHKLEMDRKVEILQQELMQRNAKESEELSRQLSEYEQRLQKALDELEASRHDRDALSRELDATKLQIKETEAQLRSVVEELLQKESGWLQEEERLQSTLSALEQELELEKEQHSKELESLQQTRGQLLKVSEQISSTMRSSQEQLTATLQQSQAQLEVAREQCCRVKAQLDQAEIDLDYSRSQAGHLQAQLDQSQAQLLQSRTELEDSRVLCEQTRVQSSHLHAQLDLLSAQLQQSRAQVSQLQTQLQASEKSAEMSVDSLLIKESEVTRLQARISSLGRAAERKSLCSHSASITEPPEPSFSSQPSLPSFRLLPASVRLSPRSHPAPLRSPAHDWPQSASLHSSTDLPHNLRGALIRELWDSSSASGSTFPGSTDQSWRGLSATEASATSDASFDPLTYMGDKPNDADVCAEAPAGRQGDDQPLTESRRESEGTLVGEDEGEMGMSSLTGMLRFVNQTLAMQQDPSPWSPIKQT
ncbi:coiled-coil domain-containing protein 18 [Poecilia reticulata]|uniref:Coiled-coil domain containing 18 n=1 Tax=Poecilia reticulata TaxID=8081 RepID=A0A3P9NQZ4_POERE|nr:PREDICTED: coiled-coil domain-containing protein 18 [Poecilia reticulata]XP_008431595.1 PREDICTED: coiled-coil domain-containing protein 18 [Poecilia reticulata]XP_008431596.1 PREDICTED: coiled-coil domain-containing protein 18 [Poecilia reticulata]